MNKLTSLALVCTIFAVLMIAATVLPTASDVSAKKVKQSIKQSTHITQTSFGGSNSASVSNTNNGGNSAIIN